MCIEFFNSYIFSLNFFGGKVGVLFDFYYIFLLFSYFYFFNVGM